MFGLSRRQRHTAPVFWLSGCRRRPPAWRCRRSGACPQAQRQGPPRVDLRLVGRFRVFSPPPIFLVGVFPVESHTYQKAWTSRLLPFLPICCRRFPAKSTNFQQKGWTSSGLLPFFSVPEFMDGLGLDHVSGKPKNVGCFLSFGQSTRSEVSFSCLVGALAVS